MQVTINLNDEELEEIIVKGVKNLSQSTIDALAKEALFKYLSQPTIMEKLVFEQINYYSDKYCPKSWVTDMIANGFDLDEMAEYRSKLLDTIKDEEKRKEILEETFAKALSSVLFNREIQTDFYQALLKITNIEQKLIEKQII